MIRTRYRSRQIVIDTSKVGNDVLINVPIQKVDIDVDTNKVVNATLTLDYIHKNATSVATQTLSYYDPVLQTTNLISVAGIDAAIRELICGWLLEKYPGTVKEGNDVWDS